MSNKNGRYSWPVNCELDAGRPLNLQNLRKSVRENSWFVALVEQFFARRLRHEYDIHVFSRKLMRLTLDALMPPCL